MLYNARLLILAEMYGVIPGGETLFRADNPFGIYQRSPTEVVPFSVQNQCEIVSDGKREKQREIL